MLDGECNGLRVQTVAVRETCHALTVTRLPQPSDTTVWIKTHRHGLIDQGIGMNKVSWNVFSLSKRGSIEYSDTMLAHQDVTFPTNDTMGHGTDGWERQEICDKQAGSSSKERGGIET